MKIKHLYYLVEFAGHAKYVARRLCPSSGYRHPGAWCADERTRSDRGPDEAATQAPTEAPTAEPTDRNGGWLDEIEYSVVDGDSAISQIQAGAIDFYSFTLASDAYPAIKEAGLPTTKSVGGYYGISLNPAVFTDPNVLNPFSNRKIREAVNWLIDRNYLNQEIYAGGSLPKLLTITTQLAEYTSQIETVRKLEQSMPITRKKPRKSLLPK